VGRGVGLVLPPLVHRAPPRVHEEVRDCGGVEAELAGDGNLHFFRRSLGFLKLSKVVVGIGPGRNIQTVIAFLALVCDKQLFWVP